MFNGYWWFGVCLAVYAWARRYLRMVLPYVFPRVGVHMRDAEEREASPAFALCLIALRVAEEVFGD